MAKKKKATARTSARKKTVSAVRVGEVFLMPDGRVGHAEMRLGGSAFMLSDEFPERGSCLSPSSLNGTSTRLWIYVKDVDAAFDCAVRAGAQPKMPVADQFWGDRMGEVVDPYGHRWILATHKEDLTPAQIRERSKAFFAKAAPSAS